MSCSKEKFIDEHHALFWYAPEESKHDVMFEKALWYYGK